MISTETEFEKEKVVNKNKSLNYELDNQNNFTDNIETNSKSKTESSYINSNLTDENFNLDSYYVENEENDSKFVFNSNQKLKIYLSVISAFIFFAILFFPMEKIIKHYFSKFAQTLKLEYSDIDLKFFGTSSIENASLILGKSFGIKSSNVLFGIPLVTINSNHQEGYIELNNVALYITPTRIQTKKISINLVLNNIKEGINHLEGVVDISTENPIMQDFHIKELENFGIDLSKLEIKKIFAKLNFEQGILKIDNTNIQSNYFKIIISGNILLKEIVSDSVPDANICLIPLPDLETINPQIFGAFNLIGGNDNKEICLKVKGTLQNPNFEKATQPQKENNNSDTSTINQNNLMNQETLAPQNPNNERSIKEKTYKPNSYWNNNSNSNVNGGNKSENDNQNSKNEFKEPSRNPSPNNNLNQEFQIKDNLLNKQIKTLSSPNIAPNN